MEDAIYTTIPYPYPGTDETPLFTKDIWIASGSPENVILAEGWLYIQSERMADVVSLKSISFPASLIGIGYHAFLNASGLEKITFNRNSQMKHIRVSVFENATALNSINIPVGVREIEAYAFLNTPMLREITFERNSQIARIDATAFSRSGLTLVVIGETALNRLNVERRALNMQPLRFGENNDFYGKANVKIVSRTQETDMLRLITRNPGYAPPPPPIFYPPPKPSFFSSITQAIGLSKPPPMILAPLISEPPPKIRKPLPKHVTEYANSFIMPEVVHKSGNTLSPTEFARAYSRRAYSRDIWVASGSPKNVILAEGWTSIERDTFDYTTSLETIRIPASVRTIENKAFRDSYDLREVTFEEGSQLEVIGGMAFSNASSLTTIRIPASVKQIDMKAFSYTTMLREITFEPNSQIADIHYIAFKGSGLKIVNIGESALRRLNDTMNRLNRRPLYYGEMQPLHFGENNNFYGKDNVNINDISAYIPAGGARKSRRRKRGIRRSGRKASRVQKTKKRKPKRRRTMKRK